MKVSVIIPTYNEEINIKECLESLININFSKKDYEIIVVDGLSHDNTRQIVKKFMKKHKNVKLYENPRRYTSSNRNMGIEKAKYDFIAFTDADCIVPKNWLITLSEGFYHNFSSNLAGVGGANIAPKDANDTTKAISLAQSTFLGNRGSSQGKCFKKVTNVESLSTSNVLYSKRMLINIGLFNEDQKHLAEDWELNYRLRKNGYKLLYLPDSFVYHKFRTNNKKFFNNMVRYGIGRMKLIKKYPDSFNPIFLVPFGFLSSILLFFIGLLMNQPLLVIPLMIYFVVVYLTSIDITKNEEFYYFFLVFQIYILQHTGYSIGMLKGIFSEKSEVY